MKTRSLAIQAVVCLATLGLTPDDVTAASWVTNSPMITARRLHTATLLPNNKVLVAGGLGVGNLASAELYDPASGTWTATGTMTGARMSHTATLLPNGKVLVAGGRGGTYLSSAELYDPATGAWTATGGMGTARMAHTATLLFNGKVLVVGGTNSTGLSARGTLYDPATSTWTQTSSMNTARAYHTAALLPNGKVLVVGGVDGSGYLSSAELYDPATGTWTGTDAMATTRGLHTATLLAGGRVLVAGGYNGSYHSSAGRYDPGTGTWGATGTMASARDLHTATLLPNGDVLVVGGYDGTYLTGAELYDANPGTWTATAGLNTGRRDHTATLLANGKVLVAGGYNGSNLASTELFDYAAGTWATTGDMISLGLRGLVQTTATLLPNGNVLVAPLSGYVRTHSGLYDPASGTWTSHAPLVEVCREDPSATLLCNGKVLLAGGGGSCMELSSTELYDPISDIWTASGSMSTAREYHTATLLPNGKVLVVGGFYNILYEDHYLATAELYDPVREQWTPTGSMTKQRRQHTATLLPNGKVLVAGGTNASGDAMYTAELYDTTTGIWTMTGSLNFSRYGHTATLLPNGKVLVAGGYHSSISPETTHTELYDPGTGMWTETGHLWFGRIRHTATLLPNGKVLVAGGFSSYVAGHYLPQVELYDPAAKASTITGSLNLGRAYHTATLLPNGRVLVAGGYNSYSGGGWLSSAELYDVGLGFRGSWQPQIAACTSSLAFGGSLLIAGSTFRGVSEGSGGNSSHDSPADYPVVQLRSIGNEQTTFLLSRSWSASSFTSAPVSSLPGGYTLATVFVNGIPSTSAVLRISVAAIHLTNVVKLPGGAFRFTFTNAPGAGFTVLASTNVALRLNTWTELGSPTETSPGQFQFTDSQASSYPRRFYRVRSP